MGRFIILDKSVPRDPKLVNAAEKLAPRVRISIDGKDLSEDEVRHALRHAGLGVTVTLWSRADVEVKRDNTLPWSVTGVQQEIGCHAELLKMLPSQWVRVRSDGLVELPGYVERNKLIPIEERKQVADHKRELARLRKQRQRERERAVSRTVTRDQTVSRTVTRDSHACHADTGTSTGIPIPISAERDSSRHQPPGSRASAEGAALAGTSGNGTKSAPIEPLEDRLRRAREMIAANPAVHDTQLKIRCGLSGADIETYLRKPAEAAP